MMNNKKYILYGLTKSFVLSFLLELYISKFGEKISLNCYIAITTALALIITVIWFVFVFKEMTFKNFICLCLLSFISFLIGLVIIAVLINVIPAYVNYTRETNVGDGVMIIAITTCFFFVSFVFEICISIIKILWLFYKGKYNK